MRRPAGGGGGGGGGEEISQKSTVKGQRSKFKRLYLGPGGCTGRGQKARKAAGKLLKDSSLLLCGGSNLQGSRGMEGPRRDLRPHPPQMHNYGGKFSWVEFSRL